MTQGLGKGLRPVPGSICLFQKLGGGHGGGFSLAQSLHPLLKDQLVPCPPLPLTPLVLLKAELKGISNHSLPSDSEGFHEP